jgi:hypothetical protein
MCEKDFSNSKQGFRNNLENWDEKRVAILAQMEDDFEC